METSITPTARDRKEYYREYNKSRPKPDKRERQKYFQEYSRKYYAENAEAEKARRREWYNNNKEKGKACVRRWAMANPEKVKTYKKIRSHKRKWFNDIRLHYGCSNPKCQWVGPFEHYMLDFHHIEPSEKKFNVSHMLQWKAELMYEEANKCCVLCSNCHRKATWGDLDCSQFRKCEIKPDGKPAC